MEGSQSAETKEYLTTLGSYSKALEEKIDNFTKEVEKAPLSMQTVSQEKKQYHKVVRGDTLYSISRKYSLSVEEVCRLNNLKQNQSIQPGQKLMVTTDRHK
jgi:LysM repeat protein